MEIWIYMKNFRLKAILLSLYILAVFCLVAIGQDSSETKRMPSLPIVPLIMEYEYFPYYISQDIPDHPQYSLIEAMFTLEDPSSLQLVLTEKDTKKRVFYCSSEKKVKIRQQEGKEAFSSKIDFKHTQADDQLPIFAFGFPDKNGQPVLWRVIPTTRPSVRGSGLAPITSAQNLRLEYRDLGTTIGEGTAVKIGDKTVEAKPWAEISNPPYFHAFHGSFTVGRHNGVLNLGTEKWRVLKQPDKLRKGGEWILANNGGRERTLRITSDYHNELVVNEVGSQVAVTSLLQLVINNTPKGFTLRSVELNNNSQSMRIKFEPELPLDFSNSTDFEGSFIINQGENKNVAGGIIVGRYQKDNYINLKWQLKSPDWARSRVIETSIKANPEGYFIEALQPANGGR